MILHNVIMVVRNLSRLDKILRNHATARKPLLRWIEVAAGSEWNSIVDARRTCPSADAIKGTDLTCFNIGGNNYRLLAVVLYDRQDVIIQELLTHAEYSKKYA